MTFSFRQIRYFIAVADAGQVSAAAANLNVSQSAVSSAIRNLETVLAVPLFQRLPGGVSLTYEGHQFLRHALNILAAVSEASRSLRRSGKSLEGRVSVGLSYTVAGYFIPQLLTRFSKSFPDVRVDLRETQRPEIEAEVEKGNLDIAVILVSNLQNRDRIGSKLLVRSQRRLWLCADHHLMAADRVPLADVAKEPYVMLSVDEADQTAYRYWNKTPFRPNVLFTTSSVEAVRSMVATGMGVTILSDMVYRPWSLEGQHVEVRELSDPVPSMDIGLIWNDEKEMSAPTMAFYEFLCLSFGDVGYGIPEPELHAG
ncbi:MAG: LysR substrate-binding domain-containing protein [Albidovulum sp.]|nr:LysR substrate-binding domain-containing protein [Albidovulum sp.]